MQLISGKDLKNLPVVTKSGIVIGKLVGLEIDTEAQAVYNYIVAPKQMVKGIFEGKLVINRESVIEVTKEKIIVVDSVSGTAPQSPKAAVAS